MILTDGVLTLRAIEERDAEVLLHMINDPEMENSVVGYSFPVSLSAQKAWIAGLSSDKNLRYAIDAGEGMVGMVSVSNLDLKNRTGNLNVKIIDSARGKGYASKALNLVIEYCFQELGLNCITANILEKNSASRALFEKAGFKLDGILRQRVYKKGNYHNLCAYSLIKSEVYE